MIKSRIEVASYSLKYLFNKYDIFNYLMIIGGIILLIASQYNAITLWISGDASAIKLGINDAFSLVSIALGSYGFIKQTKIGYDVNKHYLFDLDEFEEGCDRNLLCLSSFLPNPAAVASGKGNMNYEFNYDDSIFECKPGFLHIPVYVRNNLENVTVYDKDLEEYLAKGGKITFANKDFSPEKEIHSYIYKVGIKDDIRKFQQLALHKDIKRDRDFFNAPKVALRKLDRSQPNYQVELGDTSYFSSVITNDLFCYKILSRDMSDECLKDFKSYYPAESNPSTNVWTLSDFEHCHGVSNHIGSTILAVSSNNIPILQTQSKKSRISSNKLNVSGAGSLEKSDYLHVKKLLANKATFCDFVKFGMSRELLEETGIIKENSNRKEDVNKIFNFSQKNMHLLSLSREVLRGGLPIFIGFAKMDEPLDEIIKNNRNNQETTIVKDIKSLVFDGDDMSEFLDKYVGKGKASHQLILFRNLFKVKSVRARFDSMLKDVSDAS